MGPLFDLLGTGWGHSSTYWGQDGDTLRPIGGRVGSTVATVCPIGNRVYGDRWVGSGETTVRPICGRLGLNGATDTPFGAMRGRVGPYLCLL